MVLCLGILLSFQAPPPNSGLETWSTPEHSNLQGCNPACSSAVSNFLSVSKLQANHEPKPKRSKKILEILYYFFFSPLLRSSSPTEPGILDPPLPATQHAVAQFLTFSPSPSSSLYDCINCRLTRSLRLVRRSPQKQSHNSFEKA